MRTTKRLNKARERLRQVKGHRIQRRDWPDLKPGEFVYYVKNRLTGEMKHVVATTRERAEHMAFPEVAQDLLRSMPIHTKKEEQKNG